MKMNVMVPAGGLGNRMKVISATRLLAEKAQVPFRILWFQDWGMGCRFDDLFLSVDTPLVSLKEATLRDKIMSDRPRKRNLWLPLIFQQLMFQGRMNEKAVTRGGNRDFDFVGLAGKKHLWMASNIYFMNREIPLDAFDMFRPIPRLQQKIDEVTRDFDKNIVGVHVRRTDNERSVRTSPTWLFVERMKKEKENVKFYLATDSEDVKKEMKSVFGKRIITSPEPADRGSLPGIEDALTEMYSLARTRRIFGSAYSTFSQTAAYIGRCELELIQKRQQ